MHYSYLPTWHEWVPPPSEAGFLEAGDLMKDNSIFTICISVNNGQMSLDSACLLESPNRKQIALSYLSTCDNFDYDPQHPDTLFMNEPTMSNGKPCIRTFANSTEQEPPIELLANPPKKLIMDRTSHLPTTPKGKTKNKKYKPVALKT